MSISMSEAWVRQLQDCLQGGERYSPRDMPVLERRWQQFSVLEPLTFPIRAEGRTFRDVIGYLEGLSMIAQTNLPSTFTDRVHNFQQFTDDGIFYGAYGSRLHGQLGDLVRRLQADMDSRQAVMTIFDGGRDLAAAKKDIPCTINFQFMVRDNRLEMRTTMRSNDLWLGTPYDLTQFAMLQCTVAQVLGVRPGRYYHSVGSLHLYERDFAKAEKIDFPKDWETQAFPLWGASRLEDIVTRASHILVGDNVPNPTDFEATLMHEMRVPA
jgi:thymidylate synthase